MLRVSPVLVQNIDQQQDQILRGMVLFHFRARLHVCLPAYSLPLPQYLVWPGPSEICDGWFIDPFGTRGFFFFLHRPPGAAIRVAEERRRWCVQCLCYAYNAKKYMACAQHDTINNNLCVYSGRAALNVPLILGALTFSFGLMVERTTLLTYFIFLSPRVTAAICVKIRLPEQPEHPKPKTNKKVETLRVETHREL